MIEREASKGGTEFGWEEHYCRSIKPTFIVIGCPQNINDRMPAGTQIVLKTRKIPTVETLAESN